jgi:hypothetical protein
MTPVQRAHTGKGFPLHQNDRSGNRWHTTIFILCSTDGRTSSRLQAPCWPLRTHKEPRGGRARELHNKHLRRRSPSGSRTTGQNHISDIALHQPRHHRPRRRDLEPHRFDSTAVSLAFACSLPLPRFPAGQGR